MAELFWKMSAETRKFWVRILDSFLESNLLLSGDILFKQLSTNIMWAVNKNPGY